jgi:hypothetical protein
MSPAASSRTHHASAHIRSSAPLDDHVDQRLGRRVGVLDRTQESVRQQKRDACTRLSRQRSIGLHEGPRDGVDACLVAAAFAAEP